MSITTVVIREDLFLFFMRVLTLKKHTFQRAVAVESWKETSALSGVVVTIVTDVLVTPSLLSCRPLFARGKEGHTPKVYVTRGCCLLHRNLLFNLS